MPEPGSRRQLVTDFVFVLAVLAILAGLLALIGPTHVHLITNHEAHRLFAPAQTDG